MNSAGYRSYVIRVWPRRDAGHGIARLLIEELQSGSQVDLRDGPATELATTIARLLVAARTELQSPHRIATAHAGKESGR